MTNDIQIIAPFEPLGWQVEPWRDTSLILLLTGSAGGGKSRLAAEKIHGFCQRYAGTTALVLRKAKEYCGTSVLPFLEHAVIGDDPRVTYKRGFGRFEYENGSTIYTGGMQDQRQREAVRSIGGKGALDVVWMEEANAFVEEDFNEVLARMRGTAAPWMQLMLSTNPDAPTHWIKKRLIDDREASVYYSGAKDNPNNPAEYLAILDRLTGIQRLRLRDGLWVQAEGAIYTGFSDELHVIDRDKLPEHRGMRHFRSVDFGYNNAFVCQWWGIGPDANLYMYREIYMTKRLVEDHARQINSLTTPQEQIEATVCDHDAEDRATLERYGIPTTAAEKAVLPGIQAVQARLRKEDNGKPRLFVCRDALAEMDPALEHDKKPHSTLEEFPGYVWEDWRPGQAHKEQPHKENDHGMDALRYAVMYIDGKPRYGPPKVARYA